MKSYLRILSFVKPYKYHFGLAILASLVYVLMNSASVWMVGSLLSNIMIPESGSEMVQDIPGSASLNDQLKLWTRDLVGGGTRADQLQRLCIMLVIVFLFKNIAFYINRIFLEFVQNRLIVDIRLALYKHIQILPLSFFDKNKTAELQSIFLRDVDMMRSTFNASIQKLLIEPLNILMFLALLFIISVKMTLMILVVLPVSGWFIFKLGQSIRRKARRSSVQIAGVMNILQETLQGMRIVKAFCTEKLELNRFIAENNKFFKLIFRQARFSAMSTPVNEMIGVSIGVFLLWIGGLEVLQGSGLTPEDFIRYILLLFAMLQPAKELGNVNAKIQAGMACAERVFKILDVKSNLLDRPDARTLPGFSDSIEFRNVSFQYDSADIPALEDVSIRIRRGEIVALVGLSGAGKTTFADLVPRYYDVTAGSILIDDTDIRDVTMESLRSLMGIVTQETILFNDTVAANIAYGALDASPEKVHRAADNAHALGFINQMPDGFDTMVGEKGSRLSGGQRQRISIARAIVRNPEILILDEATSALDSEAERKVQAAIDTLVQDRTVIVIAHRLSTIMKSDRIVVLDQGRILETGTHQELLAANGRYRQLYDLQFRSEEV